MEGSGAGTRHLANAVEAAMVQRAEAAREASRVRSSAWSPRRSLTGHRHLLNPQTGFVCPANHRGFCSQGRSPEHSDNGQLAQGTRPRPPTISKSPMVFILGEG